MTNADSPAARPLTSRPIAMRNANSNSRRKRRSRNDSCGESLYAPYDAACSPAARPSAEEMTRGITVDSREAAGIAVDGGVQVEPSPLTRNALVCGLRAQIRVG